MQRGRGKIKGQPFEFTHFQMGYEALGKLPLYCAQANDLEPGVNRKWTAHSGRRTANSNAARNKATERAREERFGYAEGSTAMRKYDTPTEEEYREENLRTFGIGPRKRPHEPLAIEGQPQKRPTPETPEMSGIAPSTDSCD